MSGKRPQSALIHPGPGFRIRLDYPRDAAPYCEHLLEYDVPEISDQLNRLFAVDSRIQLLTSPDHRVCGVACTVLVFPGDNLMVHKSLDVAAPGDVIVVAAHGAREASPNAVLGDLISQKAKHRGVAGFIVDGLIRDLPGIKEIGLPVFARGTTPVGPLHRGPGEINYPIALGGTVINPGDVIIGDAAGIVAVPREVVTELIERLERKKASGAAYLESVRRGEFSNAWVDEQLAEAGCPVTGNAMRG